MKIQNVGHRLAAAAALAFVAVFAGFRCPKASAAGLLLIGGQGNDVGVTAAALRTSEWKTSASNGRWALTLEPEWQIGSWNAQHALVNKSRIIDSSVTGVLTARPRSHVISPYYLEIGLGVHILSRARIGDDRNLGSRLQFGEFLGIGAEFGERRRYSLAARFQHVSNGGIKSPNPGVNFMQILLMYRL